MMPLNLVDFTGGVMLEVVLVAFIEYVPHSYGTMT